MALCFGVLAADPLCRALESPVSDIADIAEAGVPSAPPPPPLRYPPVDGMSSVSSDSDDELKPGRLLPLLIESWLEFKFRHDPPDRWRECPPPPPPPPRTLGDDRRCCLRRSRDDLTHNAPEIQYIHNEKHTTRFLPRPRPAPRRTRQTLIPQPSDKEAHSHIPAGRLARGKQGDVLRKDFAAQFDLRVHELANTTAFEPKCVGCLLYTSPSPRDRG